MYKIFISFLLSAIILVAMGSDLDVDTNSTLFNTTLTISKSTVHDRMQHWVDAAVPYRLFTRFFLFLLTSIYQNRPNFQPIGLLRGIPHGLLRLRFYGLAVEHQLLDRISDRSVS